MSKNDTRNKEMKRREALKVILGGGTAAAAALTALPERWSKPIVESVITSAHAGPTSTPGFSTTPGFTTPEPMSITVDKFTIK